VSGQITIIRPGAAVDGDGLALPADTEIAIESETIVHVGPAQLRPGRSRLIVDLPGHTVLPGLVDMHGYLSVEPDRPDPMRRLFDPDIAGRRATALRHMARDLASGVTTIRVMGEGDGLDIVLRAAVTADPALGPSLLVAGEPLAPRGSHQARPGRGLESAADVRAAVGAAAAAGVDWIKIILTGGVNAPGDGGRRILLAPELLAVATRAARAAGLPIAVAAHGGPGIAQAIGLAVDTLEHCALCDVADVAQIVAAARTRPVLTLSRFFAADGIARSAAGSPDILANLERARAALRVLVGAIAAAGAPFGIGTDNMHGAIADDACLAVDFGLPPRRVLAALTGGAAAILGRTGTIGFLRAGMRADLVAVEGDPLADITALARVSDVWHRGLRVRIT